MKNISKLRVNPRSSGALTLLTMAVLGLSFNLQASDWSLKDGKLMVDDIIVMDNVMGSVNKNIKLVNPSGKKSSGLSSELSGVVVEFSSAKAFSEKNFAFANAHKLVKYAAAYRKKSSSWMMPKIGTAAIKIPRETQFMLLSHTSDKFTKQPDQAPRQTYTLVISLVGKAMRSSLIGGDDTQINVIIESGDPAVKQKSAAGVYLIHGDDPYEMMSIAASEIKRFKGKSINDRAPVRPEYVGLLGWSTWNAFYDKVDEAGVKKGLTEFKQGGAPIGWMQLDAGWQMSKDKRLTGFDAQPKKFPNGIKGFVSDLKSDYGVKKVMTWQTIWGYWTGFDPQAFADADISNKVELRNMHIPARLEKTLNAKDKKLTPEEEILQRFYPYNSIGKNRQVYFPELSGFYHDYHSYLAKQGVDGVKIDAMSWAEMIGLNRGGRVSEITKMIAAMDNSTTNLFKNNNSLFCSAMNNDFILNANRDSVSRNSHDYFPNIPASHGEHIAANAHNSFWTGEFIIPDWDMFESGHYSGAFHAASRAISGGPIYLSDKLGKHNFSVLKKLSFADSRTPVSLSWGKPTLDSFFIDPATDRAPIKIFNQNKTNYVIGAFNTFYDKSEAVTVRGYVSPKDIPGLTGEQFVIYSHQKQSLVLLSKNTEEQVILDDLGFDIFTIAPVNAGFAPIGLTDKYNSGATITDYHAKKNTKTITLMGKGHFIAYSAKAPKKVSVNGKKAAFEYNQSTSVLSVDINTGEDPALKIVF